MFSSRVSSLGLARSVQVTIPHTAPVDGVSPYLAEKRHFKKSSPAFTRPPVVASRGVLSSGVSATVNAFGQTQVRMAHTDVSCPDFSTHRREVTLDPHTSSSESKYQRKAYSYGVGSLVGIAGLVTGKSALKGYIRLFSPDKMSAVLSKIEVNLSNLAPGFGMTVMWQGKPLYIRHRTPEEIEELNATNLAELRDPQTDAERFPNQEWTVVIGICTHMGCAPISHAGDFNGYYCPCHSSHYDVGGRIRKGPAPENLAVPTHVFQEDGLLLVG